MTAAAASASEAAAAEAEAKVAMLSKGLMQQRAKIIDQKTCQCTEYVHR